MGFVERVRRRGSVDTRKGKKEIRMDERKEERQEKKPLGT